jgi:cysteine-rich repeat protein
MHPWVLNATDCKKCHQLWANCNQCDNTTCTLCLLGYTLNITDCFQCGEAWPGCTSCNGTACSNCAAPYLLNGTECSPNCLLIDNCTTCEVLSGQLFCLNCSYALTVQNNECLPVCGDGLLASGLEQCDDNNTINKDGCSSSCTLEDYFQCNTTAQPS